jgi:hypothetical protein
MDETKQAEGAENGGFVRFGRRHPMWTIVGVAAAGLAGGVEMAAGVLLGAAALALLRRTEAKPPPEAPREHPGLQKLRDRAHAVVMAARGEQPHAH